MSGSRKKFDTLCIHAGQTTDPATGAVMPPIYTSTTFEHEAFGQAGEYAYSRGANPTRGALERCVAELEGGVRGFAYASGMAATAAVLELLEAGSHVIAQQGIYGGTLRLFNQVRRHSAGLDFTFVDFFDLQRVESLLRPETRLIWVETPTNPLLDVVDLTAVAELAPSRCAGLRRQYLCQSDSPTAAGTGLRHCHALVDQVPGRPFRCPRRHQRRC
jgi:cystathionine gamma-lyase